MTARSNRPVVAGPRPIRRIVRLALASALLIRGADAAPPPDRETPGMHASGRQPLIVAYHEQYRHDPELFRACVEARYNESTLRRLVRAEDPRARRASIEAIGLVGSMASNADLASALGDVDPEARGLAVAALWAVWFRADTTENNARLRRVSELIGRGLLVAAEREATALIEAAPNFAEAHNQRAIARFAQGRFLDSAADCRRVLEGNPYHIGALGGLAQCYLRLGRDDLALGALRRTLELQPRDEGLRRLVASMEKGR